ncbi:MAG: hypothetical protein ABSG32_25015 [Terriglobia bacterium]
MKIHPIMLWLWVIASLAARPGPAKAQSLVESGDPPGTRAATTPAPLHLAYTRPTQKTKVHNYLFDAFGPYPITGGALTAWYGQARNLPPEWGQGAEGYSRRFVSDLGIAAASTTTRYALSEVFREDTLYYRCECTGVMPRLRHAVLSTLTARRGEDGHRVFSFPALIAPYAGTMTAVYGWYPSRYGAMNAFRMGNYSLLEYMAGNIALEFIYSGPHSLRNRMHLNNGHGAPNPGLQPELTGK